MRSFHTYFVGTASGGVWVHNGDKCQQPIVIGENMDRVKRFADAIGATFFKPTSVNEANWLSNNKHAIWRWIRTGKTIIDIGTDPARHFRSEFYAAEQKIVARAVVTGAMRAYQYIRVLGEQ